MSESKLMKFLLSVCTFILILSIFGVFISQMMNVGQYGTKYEFLVKEVDRIEKFYGERIIKLDELVKALTARFDAIDDPHVLKKTLEKVNEDLESISLLVEDYQLILENLDGLPAK